MRNGDPPPAPATETLTGDALEAFALNARVMANPDASDAERAVALCWVMHVGGDIHQPLDAAQLSSLRRIRAETTAARSSSCGNAQTREPVTLHWFWDDAVQRVGEPAAVQARARELAARLPRASLKELAKPSRASDFPSWARDESHPL